MSMQRFLAAAEALGDREVGIICATAQLARDGHVLEPAGIDLTNYRRNPIVLWSHQPEEPVGVCTAVGIENGALAARVEFAPSGVSAKADEVCSLVKAGVVAGVSIGFDPIEAAPLDPAKGSRGGLHITAAELLEISFCAVPVDTGARVVARSFSSRPGTLSMLRSLPTTSPRAVERALVYIGQSYRSAWRLGVRTPRQEWERERQHTMTVWAIEQARSAERNAREEEFSYARRQAVLRDLSQGD